MPTKSCESPQAFVASPPTLAADVADHSWMIGERWRFWGPLQFESGQHFQGVKTGACLITQQSGQQGDQIEHSKRFGQLHWRILLLEIVHAVHAIILCWLGDPRDTCADVSTGGHSGRATTYRYRRCAPRGRKKSEMNPKIALRWEG